MSNEGHNILASLRSSARSLLDCLSARCSGGRAERGTRLFLLLLTALVLALLISPRTQFHARRYEAGDIASASIRATQDYLLEDVPLTEKRRREAEAAAPLVYLRHDSAPSALSDRLQHAFAAAAEKPDADGRGRVAQILGFTPTQREMAVLARTRWERAEGEVRRTAGLIYARNIVADRNVFANDSIQGILVVEASSGTPLPAGDTAAVIGLQDARRLLEGMRIKLDGSGGEVLKGLLARLLQPNLVFDREATEQKRREARVAVRPVLFQVKRGEMIVREGERVREDQAYKLKTIFDSGSGLNLLLSSLGLFSLALIIFSFTYRFARKNIRKFNPSNRDLLLLAWVTVAHFLILKIGLLVSTAMGGVFPWIRTSDYFFLFPFALAAMLVRIVLNSEVALVHCAVCAIFTGIMFENNLTVLVYALIGGVVGAHGVRQCTNRGTLYTAGMKVSVVNLALALTFQLMGDMLLSVQTLVCAAFALGSGIFSAALATAAIPVVETFFQYTTDIKLLELANLNSPILRELM
ncbi:MAG TPA: HD family phosphohydrolase, partial [Verrucomicrobiae bacterium]|nr:HD family phosphohydrolase [Verrucomicrobiae bacterium]